MGAQYILQKEVVSKGPLGNSSHVHDLYFRPKSCRRDVSFLFKMHKTAKSAIRMASQQLQKTQPPAPSPPLPSLFENLPEKLRDCSQRPAALDHTKTLYLLLLF
jgi:hypothetical protein